jgi:hypothetical protein
MDVKLGLSLAVSENKLMRRIFASKRDETREDWRKLLGEEFCTLRRILLG